MASIEAGRHYEISSAEVAKWLEQQGVDQWWNVDGDPLLTGRVAFPCPADELAAELRKLNRPLLVQAQNCDSPAHEIDAKDFGRLGARYLGNPVVAGPMPDHVNDRAFYLCWKGSRHEWLLIEDGETAKLYGEDAAPNATQE